MLTPEYLSDIEFNEVVKLYNQLNIDITADIIERVSQMQQITETTRDQLKILMQTNGTEIFNSALNNASNLTADTKKALKDLYTDVAKNDMKSYKNLYEYRDKAFKLSETQYKIINQGLKDTNRTLKNLTNSIAFRSQQIYIEAVDRAYMQAISGGISYTTAIDNAIQELAEKGITLKDKAGRNVQLEVAVRRNVMNGIRETSNKMERDIEEYLGCDGYEVTAHMGARPEHAEEQGKQFAVKKEDAKKYGIGLWNDVEHLWHEYNCRHSYFGIILGVSEPIYDKEELKEMEDATVTYDCKQVPLYNATQIQRQYENAIRKSKRAVQTLQKAEQDTSKAQMKLNKVTKEYNSFLKETGLQKDYSRIKVSKMTNGNKNSIIENNINKISWGNLESALGKQHIDIIEKTILNADKNIQKAWNKNIDKVNINEINWKGTAHYSWNSDGIYIDLEKISKDKYADFVGKDKEELFKKAYGTLYHETGHHISAIYSRKEGYDKDVSEWFESKKYFKEQFSKTGEKVKVGKTLDEMIKEEGWNYIDAKLKTMRAEAKANGVKATKINSKDVYNQIKTELRELKVIESTDISDMFDGITNGKAYGYTQHSYSTKNYWRTHVVGEEAFAEMFDATINNPSSLTKIREYFPKSYDIFMEIIKEMGK